MKTVATLALTLTLLLGLYPTAGIVTDVDYTEDLVTVELQSGHLYQFYGAEDWLVGDIAAMLMSSCSTPEVTDDAILSVRYVGYAK